MSTIQYLDHVSPDGVSTFTVYDYVVFIIFILISITVGIFVSLRNKIPSIEHFLVGGKAMPLLPVAFSLIGGSISAVSILGNSTEIYLHGSQLALNLMGAFWGILFLKSQILPVFYPLNIISIFTYLELRFGSVILRKIAVACNMCANMFYLGACLYTPSLALSSVTNISPEVLVVVVGVICSIYTAIGGVIAVVYTDVFQTLIMLFGVLTVTIVGCFNMGGIDNIRKIAMEGDRLNMFNLDFNPLVRHTFWSVQVLGIFFIIGSYGLQQAQFQRFISVKSLKKSKQLATIYYPGLFILWTLFYFTGLVAYAVYKDCDPLTSGRIQKADQILPYLVGDVLSAFPGLCGLFVAGVYGGVLSTLSSVTNGMACNVWEDILKDIHYFDKMTERGATRVVQLISFIAGILTIGVALIIERLGTIFQAMYTISGVFTGPTSGLFIAGIFGPWINLKGVVVGFFSSLLFNLWILVGRYVTGSGKEPNLPLSVTGCPENQNNTFLYDAQEIREDIVNEYSIYDLSYCYIGALAIIIVYIISTIVSLLTGVTKPNDVKEECTNENMLNFYKYLHDKCSG